MSLDAGDSSLDGAASAAHEIAFPASDDRGSTADAQEPPPFYVTSRELGVDSRFTCGDLCDSSDLGELLHCGGANQIGVDPEATHREI